MVPSLSSTLPSKLQRPPSHPSTSTTLPSSSSSRTPTRSQHRSDSISSGSSLRSRPRPINHPRITYITSPPHHYYSRSRHSSDHTRVRLLDIFDGLVTTDPTHHTNTRHSCTKEIPPCLLISSPDTMTASLSQLGAALHAEIKVVFNDGGVIDMLGGLNTG